MNETETKQKIWPSRIYWKQNIYSKIPVLTNTKNHLYSLELNERIKSKIPELTDTKKQFYSLELIERMISILRSQN